MTTLRLWPATDGPALPSSDPVDYTLGTEFEVTEACDFTAWHWWCQTNATVSFGLYQVDSAASGTLLASVAGVAVVAGGWRRTAAAAPVALTPGVRYRVVVFSTTDGFYCTTPNYWSSGAGSAGIVNGALEAPNAAGATGGDQGSFTATVGVMTFPTDSFNSTNYWIDAEVETADEPVSYPATGTVEIVTSTQGTATANHVATGTVAVTTSANGSPRVTAGGGGVTPFVSVLETLQKVLDTLTTPAASGGCPLTTQPCRVALYPGGEVAFDTCGTSCSGGREGQLWANLQPSSVNTVSAGNGCAVITFTAEIGITRCAPSPGRNGEPPSVEAVAAAAWQQARDADEILVALTCCDALTADDRDKLTPTAWRPVDPSGDCLGGVWTITGALSMCC